MHHGGAKKLVAVRVIYYGELTSYQRLSEAPATDGLLCVSDPRRLHRNT